MPSRLSREFFAAASAVSVVWLLATLPASNAQPRGPHENRPAGEPGRNASSNAANASTPAAPPKPTAEQLEDWVNQLAAPKPELRDAALEKLVNAGEAALPALERALQRQNLELRWRARRAQLLCQWGLTLQMEDIEDALPMFLEAEPEYRLRLLGEWSRRYGAALIGFLKQVCMTDPDSNVRESTFKLLGNVGAKKEVMIELAERCAKLEAGAGWAWQALARFYRDTGRDEEAVRCLKQVLNINPRDYNANEQLAEIYTKRNDLVQAVQFHQAALALAAPNDRLKHTRELAKLYLRQGDREKAVAAMETLFADNKKDVETAMALLDFYFDHDMLDKARGLAQAALKAWTDEEFAPHVQRLLFQMAFAAWDRGDSKSLIEPLTKLLETYQPDPDDPERVQSEAFGAAAMLAWALTREGRPDEAGKVFAGFVTKQVAEPTILTQALRVAKRLNLRDAVTAIGAEYAKLVANAPLLPVADWLYERDYTAAAEALHKAQRQLEQAKGGMSVPEWFEILHLWDQIGDSERVADVIAKVVQQPGFGEHVRYAFDGVLSASSIVALLKNAYELNSKKPEALEFGRTYGRALAELGRYSDARVVFQELIDSGRLDTYEVEWMQDIVLRCHMAAGETDVARKVLETKLATGDSEAGLRLALMELRLGNLRRSLEICEQVRTIQMRMSNYALLMDFAWRLGELERVTREGDSAAKQRDPEDSESIATIELLRARAELAQGKFSEARTRLLSILTQTDFERPVDEFRMLEALCLLGDGDKVLAHLMAAPVEAPGPESIMFFISNFASQRGPDHARFLRMMARGLAQEATGKPAAAVRTYLEATREACLDYHLRWVDERLKASATPDALQTVIRELLSELSPVFGAKLESGQISTIRQTQTRKLRMLAHAYALAGRWGDAQTLLENTIALGEKLDLDFWEACHDDHNFSSRDIGLNRICDVTVEWIGMMLRPATVPGIQPAALAALDGSDAAKQARAERALAMAQRWSDSMPNDFRLAALQIEAATIAKQITPSTQAKAKRLAEFRTPDNGNSYVAGFYFAVHGMDDLAMPFFRRNLKQTTTQTFIESNSDEYLSRMLYRNPATRREACEMIKRNMHRVSYQGWTIDEDWYEGYAYEGYLAQQAVVDATAAGDAAAAQKSAENAAFYRADDFAPALVLGAIHAAAGRPTEAAIRLRRWDIELTLAARAWPNDPTIKARLAALEKLPGVTFPPVPATK